MSLPAWEALLPDPLVLARQAEIQAENFLDQARNAAEQGDWNTIQQMIAEARTRFADNPWVLEILEGLAELARTMDASRFRKEAMYSGRKMGSRVSAKDEVLACMAAEASVPSFLRRKKMQGKAQFDPRPGDEVR